MTTSHSPSDYVSVRLGTLRPNEILAFDVFVKVTDRYIRHTLSGDTLDQDRWALLKSKGVKKVFISHDAENRYLEYLDRALGSLESSDISLEDKGRLAQNALVSLAENKNMIETESSYRVTQGRVNKITEFLLSDKSHVNGFLKNTGVSEDVAQHSATVSTLSLALADHIGITQKEDLLSLGIAALLHDVGRQDESFQWNESIDKFSPDQKALYLAHPAKAEELLSQKAFVSAEIRTLVRHHEEVGQGVGFPDGLRVDTLPEIQQILNLCNLYDAYCMRNRLPLAEASKQFFIDKVGTFKLDLMTALSEIIKGQL